MDMSWRDFSMYYTGSYVLSKPTAERPDVYMLRIEDINEIAPGRFEVRINRWPIAACAAPRAAGVPAMTDKLQYTDTAQLLAQMEVIAPVGGYVCTDECLLYIQRQAGRTSRKGLNWEGFNKEGPLVWGKPMSESWYALAIIKPRVYQSYAEAIARARQMKPSVLNPNLCIVPEGEGARIAHIVYCEERVGQVSLQTGDAVLISAAEELRGPLRRAGCDNPKFTLDLNPEPTQLPTVEQQGSLYIVRRPWAGTGLNATEVKLEIPEVPVKWQKKSFVTLLSCYRMAMLGMMSVDTHAAVKLAVSSIIDVVKCSPAGAGVSRCRMHDDLTLQQYLIWLTGGNMEPDFMPDLDVDGATIRAMGPFPGLFHGYTKCMLAAVPDRYPMCAFMWDDERILVLLTLLCKDMALMTDNSPVRWPYEWTGAKMVNFAESKPDDLKGQRLFEGQIFSSMFRRFSTTIYECSHPLLPTLIGHYGFPDRLLSGNWRLMGEGTWTRLMTRRSMMDREGIVPGIANFDRPADALLPAARVDDLAREMRMMEQNMHDIEVRAVAEPPPAEARALRNAGQRAAGDAMELQMRWIDEVINPLRGGRN